MKDKDKIVWGSSKTTLEALEHISALDKLIYALNFNLLYKVLMVALLITISGMLWGAYARSSLMFVGFLVPFLLVCGYFIDMCSGTVAVIEALLKMNPGISLEDIIEGEE